MRPLHTLIGITTCLAGLTCTAPWSLAANPLQQALEIGRSGQQEARRTQKAVESLDDAREELRRRYAEALRQIDAQRAFNSQLESQIAEQRLRLDSTHLEQRDAAAVRQELFPLMRQMAAVIEEFVSLDLPFQLPLRRARAVGLLQDLEAPDIGIAEAYRRIAETYRAELDYSYTLEAYNGVVEVEQSQRAVEFLRVGRLGLYYLAPSQKTAGFWDRESRAWLPLPEDSIPALARGIRIALQQASPELIALPVSAPVNAE